MEQNESFVDLLPIANDENIVEFKARCEGILEREHDASDEIMARIGLALLDASLPVPIVGTDGNGILRERFTCLMAGMVGASELDEPELARIYSSAMDSRVRSWAAFLLGYAIYGKQDIHEPGPHAAAALLKAIEWWERSLACDSDSSGSWSIWALLAESYLECFTRNQGGQGNPQIGGMMLFCSDWAYEKAVAVSPHCTPLRDIRNHVTRDMIQKLDGRCFEGGGSPRCYALSSRGKEHYRGDDYDTASFFFLQALAHANIDRQRYFCHMPLAGIIIFKYDQDYSRILAEATDEELRFAREHLNAAGEVMPGACLDPGEQNRYVELAGGIESLERDRDMGPLSAGGESLQQEACGALQTGQAIGGSFREVMLQAQSLRTQGKAEGSGPLLQQAEGLIQSDDDRSWWHAEMALGLIAQYADTGEMYRRAPFEEYEEALYHLEQHKETLERSRQTLATSIDSLYQHIKMGHDLRLQKRQERDARSSSGSEARAKSGPCFVATAVYGSPMAQEVQVLREYRDAVLRRSASGQSFIWVYERVGPSLARLITKRDLAKAIVRRLLLKPMVALVRRRMSA